MSSQVACIQCRQQKVRCIGRDENNDRCERCRKRNLECVVDENFKRTVKRKAVETLEQEIEQLKAQLAAVTAKVPVGAANDVELNANGAAASDQNGNTSANSSKRIRVQPVVPQMTPPRFEPPQHQIITPQPALVQVSSWTCAAKSSTTAPCEALTLDPDTIELLFKEYVLYYHRVLPVVEIQRGPEFVYSASPALFWTIMAIGSRRRSRDLPKGIDFERLCAVQKLHLSEIAVSPVLGDGKSTKFNLPSLYAVQAFILCTLWPPPTSSINADMSWNSIGIALLTANRAGLHCPGYAKDFERIFKSNKMHRTNMREQLVTWLATNALSQAIANMFGYPSAATFRAHREFLFHNLDLPPRVRHMYEIQRTAHDIEKCLGLIGQGSSTELNASMMSSLIRVHAARYDQIEAEFGHEMDSWTLFTLYAGRAQLFSYYLYGNMCEESALLLYNSCLTLLNHVALQPKEYVKYLPVVSIMILWQTTSVVARLYFSRWSFNLDKISGERLYRIVVKQVSMSSVFEHDLPYRAAEIMLQMWGTFRAMYKAGNERLISGNLILKSRMSASGFFDSLWLMREGAEIRSQAPLTLTKPTPEGHNLGTNLPPIVPTKNGESASISQLTPLTSSNTPQISPPPHTDQVSVCAPAHPGIMGGDNPQLTPTSLPLSLRPMASAHTQSEMQHITHPHFSDMTQRVFPIPTQDPWMQSTLPSLGAAMSPEPSVGILARNPLDSPVSPSMIDGSWADMGPEMASTIWRDVNSVMEDFGFGLGELPYVSP